METKGIQTIPECEEKLDTGDTIEYSAADTATESVVADIAEEERRYAKALEEEAHAKLRDDEEARYAMLCEEAEAHLIKAREEYEAYMATKNEEPKDYSLVIEEDLRALKRDFPELASITDITELDNPMRYAALRDLGLTAREAYLATSDRRTARDNRAHLSPAAPRRAGVPTGGMTRSELERARELFSGMNDAEIQALYRRVAR